MKTTPLCEIAFKYGTDKCPQIGHNYTPVYYEMLKDKRESVKKVLELGIGSSQTMAWIPKHYQTGASLRMWRDFFPKAQIYGVDRHPSTIFEDERIKTFMLSTTNPDNLKKLIIEIGSDIDLVIDDGPHNERFQLQTARTLLPLFQKGCIYIIEDVKKPNLVKRQLSHYNCTVVASPRKVSYNKPRNDNLIIIKNRLIKKPMLNLMIYINPAKKFDDEKADLVKIQIDNSLRLGWRKKDILLVTNFPYKYKEVKALVIDDSTFCEIHDKASKINAIIYLLGNNMIRPGQLYWFHDFDAFQTNKFTEKQLKLDDVDLGFADYGWKARWNTGSFFFRSGTEKVFEWIRNELYKYRLHDEEEALTRLTNRNYKNINQMYKRMNITYDFPACMNGMRKMVSNYKRADKPIKVMHFHPMYKGVNYLEKNCIDNPLKKPLIPKGLIKIFKKHLPDVSKNI